MITDAQVHIWNANTPEDPWEPKAESHLPDAMPAEHKLLPRWLEQPGMRSLRLSMNEPEHQKLLADMRMMMHGTAARVFKWPAE